MSRNTKNPTKQPTRQPTNSFPYSHEAPEGYDDTESEADSTDAGHDPPARGTDNRGVQGNEGEGNAENDFSEVDPRQGLNPIHRVFLDYNNVNDPDFLSRSIAYLRRHHRQLRSQDVFEWRQRARCALRDGASSEARRLIQQALLIKLSQNVTDSGNLTAPDFGWFIRKTYTLYLRFLVEAEYDGLLWDRRAEMLHPWRAWVKEAWDEDIMESLLNSSYPLSTTFIPSLTIKPAVTHPSLADRSRNSVPSLPRPTDNKVLQSSDDSRSNTTSISQPLHRDTRRDKEAYSTSPYSHTRPGTLEPGSRLERQGTRYAEATIRPPAQTTGVQSKPIVRKEQYVTDPSRTSHKRTPEGVVEGLGREEPERGKREGRQESVLSSTGRSDVRRDGRNYVHQPGQVDPQATPRLPPSSNSDVQTRRSPTSTVTSTATQPINSSLGLSELMKRFVAQNDYRDCLRFAESNPAIFDEDLQSLQNIAVHYLRQGQTDSARHIIARRLMLQVAKRSADDNLAHMRKLPTVKKTREDFEQRVEMILEDLEDAVLAMSQPPVQTSSKGPQKVVQRR